MAVEDPALTKSVSTLLSLHSHGADSSYPITDDMIIGRESDCSITLDSPYISRYHAKVVISQEGVFIEDLLSTHGTYVNGRRISNRVKLKTGDELKFHDIGFTLNSPNICEQQAAVSTGQPSDKKTADAPKVKLQNPQKKSEEKKTLSVESTYNTHDIDSFAESLERNTEHFSAKQLNHIARTSALHKREESLGQTPRLEVIPTGAPKRTFTFDIDNEQQWTIGRDQAADIRLADEKAVTLDHAYIRLEEEGLVINTSRTTNGLLVNGHFTDSAILRDGDILQIGTVTMTYRNTAIINDDIAMDTSEPTNQLHWSDSIGMWISGVVIAAAFITSLVKSF